MPGNGTGSRGAGGAGAHGYAFPSDDARILRDCLELLVGSVEVSRRKRGAGCDLAEAQVWLSSRVTSTAAPALASDAAGEVLNLALGGASGQCVIRMRSRRASGSSRRRWTIFRRSGGAQSFLLVSCLSRGSGWAGAGRRERRRWREAMRTLHQRRERSGLIVMPRRLWGRAWAVGRFRAARGWRG